MDYDELSEKWRAEGKDTKQMPAIVVEYNHHNTTLKLRDRDFRDTHGINWKLTLDDPPNMNLLAHYYPTMGLSKGFTLVDVTDYKYELKDYVTRLPNYPQTMIRNEISVPCFYLHYRDNWCWTTKQPFPAEIDKHMGYSCSAIPVIPNIFKLVTNDREDRYSGDNWIEFNGKRFVIGDLYELEQAYQALDLEINFLYFGNNDGIHT